MLAPAPSCRCGNAPHPVPIYLCFYLFSPRSTVREGSLVWSLSLVVIDRHPSLPPPSVDCWAFFRTGVFVFCLIFVRRHIARCSTGPGTWTSSLRNSSLCLWWRTCTGASPASPTSTMSRYAILYYHIYRYAILPHFCSSYYHLFALLSHLCFMITFVLYFLIT